MATDGGEEKNRSISGAQQNYEARDLTRIIRMCRYEAKLAAMPNEHRASYTRKSRGFGVAYEEDKQADESRLQE
jgi:hypothetical protein